MKEFMKKVYKYLILILVVFSVSTNIAYAIDDPENDDLSIAASVIHYPLSITPEHYVDGSALDLDYLGIPFFIDEEYDLPDLAILKKTFNLEASHGASVRIWTNNPDEDNGCFLEGVWNIQVGMIVTIIPDGINGLSTTMPVNSGSSPAPNSNLTIAYAATKFTTGSDVGPVTFVCTVNAEYE